MARILVLDDEPEIVEVLVAMMASAGHKILASPPGTEAWDVLRDGSYELVVTDLGMPQLDGLALARWIGMNRPGVPVIAVSGIIADLQRMQGPSPFAAALQKPLRKRELLAAIDAALGGRFA